MPTSLKTLLVTAFALGSTACVKYDDTGCNPKGANWYYDVNRHECVELKAGEYFVARDGGASDVGGDGANVDGSRDGAVEAAIDAGPCGMTCGGATPFCDEALRRCVACLGMARVVVTTSDAGASDAAVADGATVDGGAVTVSRTIEPAMGCASTSPACNVGACVECTANEQCLAAARPRCIVATGGALDGGAGVDSGSAGGSANTCAACTESFCGASSKHCAVSGANSGACVECTEDAHCGGRACNRRTNRCTTRSVASVDVCNVCEADTECMTGMRCVTHRFMGTDVGSYCFLVARSVTDGGPAGCGEVDVALRPYTMVAAASVDGTAGDHCLPPAFATCQSLTDLRNKTCSTNDECGLTGVDDGYCPGAGMLCTHRCGGGVDCRDPLRCIGAPTRCAP